MTVTRLTADGSVVEVPPATLDCGHPFAGNVTIGYQPDPAGGRSRSYYCRTCRQVTYAEPDGGRGAVALGR